MSVSALSDSLTESAHSPGERGLQLDDQSLASCEHLEVPRHALGDHAGVEMHEVDAVVGVRRAMVEERQPSRARLAGDVDRVVDRRVAEVALALELLARVLGVVDQQVDAVGEVEHVRWYE